VAGRLLTWASTKGPADETIALSEQQIMDQLAERLAGVYTDVESDQVARVVSGEYSRFETGRFRDFIPLFVERHSANRLSKPESVDG
jgi:hypothetical protein